MDHYLNRPQWAQLIAPINPKRVGHKDGLSHVESYDVRAHLNRVFGFARWSEDVTDLVMLYEQSKGEGAEPRWRTAYRATIRLTVNAPDGTLLATYTAAAVGTNFGWLPDSKRDDAHDMAIKTASSQALKRCAINLGDQFGLSLYQKGSIAPLVAATIVAPPEAAPTGSAQPAHQDVTAHIVAPLAPEDSPVGQAEPETPPQPAPPAAPARQGTDPAGEMQPLSSVVADLREKALKATKKPELLRLLMEVGKSKVGEEMTSDESGRGMSLESLINARIREVAA